MSILKKNNIQHWLDTPKGSYVGYPKYGNSVPELLFLNKQELDYALGVIINQMKNDLGASVVERITDMYITSDKNDIDMFYLIIIQKDTVAVGGFSVSQ